MFCEPVPSQKAIKVAQFVSRMRKGREMYKIALRNVADERGELIKCQDELDDAEDNLMKLRAKTRLERQEARNVVMNFAAEVEEQQLAVDDAENELIAAAKATVSSIVEASKLIKAGPLPKFRFDIEKSLGDTTSSREMSAARDWLRQLSGWCLRAEAKIKLNVAERYINSLRIMGILNQAAFRDKGDKMLEEASLVDVITTICCECDYRLVCYCEDTQTFFVEKKEVDYLGDGDLISGELVLEAYNVLDVGVDLKAQVEEIGGKGVVTTCLSDVVRQAMLSGTAKDLRQILTNLSTHEDALQFQSNRGHALPSIFESKRIRGFLRKISRHCVLTSVPKEAPFREGSNESESPTPSSKYFEVQIGKAVDVVDGMVQSRKEELAEERKKFAEDGGLFGVLGREADEAEEKEALQQSSGSKKKDQHKKKGISCAPIAYLEQTQVKFELDLHVQKVHKMLSSDEKKGKVGGGIYLFPPRD